MAAMKLDPHSEAKLAQVHPELASKVRQLAEMLHLEGIEFRVTQGLRTWAEQAKLYAQGRTAPGKRVTDAEPGESWHNFGLAIDLAPDDPKLPGYQPDWNAKHPAWKRLVAVGESLGLRSGKAWNDLPHFELTGRWGTKPDQEVLQLFEGGGIAAIWAEVSGTSV